MAPQCCVAGCPPPRLEGGDDVTYFPFPVSLSLRRTWRAVLPSSSNITNDAMVCSRHFTNKDLETYRGKIRLKRKVIPSRFGQACNEPSPPSDRSSSPPTHVRRTRQTRRTRSRRNGRRQYEEDDTSTDEEEVDSERSEDSDPEFRVKAKAVKKYIPQRSKSKASNANDEIDESQSNDERGDERPNGDENGDEVQVTPDICDMMDMLVQYGDVADDKDKCTIECVPEIHPPESGSDDEKPANEDIEDIIANYHIKQDKELAERLLAAQAVERERLEREKRERDRKERELQDKKQKEKLEAALAAQKKENEIGNKVLAIHSKRPAVSKTRSVYRPKRPNGPPVPATMICDSSSDDDCIDTTPGTNYVEIAVGDGNVDDCLMVMEDVQVLLDPESLMMDDHDHMMPGDDPVATNNKHNPPVPPHPLSLPPTGADHISLLTSSDDDDVIIQEPVIEKIEVSDETDEDDIPLTRIAQLAAAPKPAPPAWPPAHKPVAFDPKTLWNSTMENFCYECHWKTNSRSAMQRHRRKHAEDRDGKDNLYGLERKRRVDYNDGTQVQHTVMRMCDQCSFSTASASQLAKHRQKHKNDKRYKCTRCDYRAKHQMALHYHMRVHEPVKVDVMAPNVKVTVVHKPKMKYRCQNCSQKSSSEAEMLRHSRVCRKQATTGTGTPKSKSKHSTKIYTCKKCSYTSNRSSDLRRHNARKHKGSDDDEDFEP